MWYSASLLFEAVHERHPDDNRLWEEQIVLIEAADAADAERRAIALGKRLEHQYATEDDIVHWVFRRVESVCEIAAPQLADGTELFSRFLRKSEVDSLLTPFGDSL